MTYLDRLKNRKVPRMDATNATKTPAVAFVAYPPGTFENSLPIYAANDPVPVSAANDPANPRRVDWGPGAEPPADVLARLRAKSQAADARLVGMLDPDPDRACWPNGPAWSEAEFDAFSVRLIRFIGAGMAARNSETLADRLVTRDRDQDDRAACLECRHCQQGRCTNWRAAGLGQAQIPAELSTTLQRCGGFRPWA